MTLFSTGVSAAAKTSRVGNSITRSGSTRATKGAIRRLASRGRAGNIQQGVGLTQMGVGRRIQGAGRAMDNHPEMAGLAITAGAVGVGAGAGKSAADRVKFHNAKAAKKRKKALKKNDSVSAFGIDHG